MGSVGGMLGLGGGAGGTGFGGPSMANLQKPTTGDQARDQYKQAQDAYQQQQAFLAATQAQNGLGNQSNVYNQLNQVAQGQGPNPAQAQLAQATQANTANQAALMAGQRGAGANVGLLARQAAMQGAQNQQQSIGQAATLQAQQSLNALNSMGNLATQQANQQAGATSSLNQFAQGEQNNILNGIASQNNAEVGAASSVNNANASMANTRMGQQGALLGNVMGGIGSAFSLADGGIVPSSGQYAPVDPNNDPFNNQANPSKEVLPASTQATNAPKGPKSNVGKMFNAATQSAPQGDGMAQAGQFIGKALGAGLKSIFSGSSTPKTQDPYAQYSASGFSPEQMATDKSRQDAVDAGALPSAQDPSQQLQTSYGHDNSSEQMTASNDESQFNAAKGGKVPAMVSPGEVYLNRKAVKKVEDGKDPIHAGEKIKGKAKVKGDSLKNDTVPKTLESGGIVLPKSVMEHAHPHWAAHKFVSDILAKQGKLPAKKVK